MASDRLRREIESLLRFRLRLRIAQRVRGPVLGARTSARWLDLPEVPREPVDGTGSDNGVLAWGDPVSYPLEVHVGTYLMDYHTAGATVIPWSDPPRSEYLTGILSLHPTETCPGGTKLPSYIGRESEFSPHDAVVWDDETQGTLNAGILRAEQWSGLMRLWMQARARIGLKVLPTVPGWPNEFIVAPDRMGLIRSPQGVYWLAYAHSTGIQLARMRIAYPGTYGCTLSIANSGTLSGAAQELADVEALSRLELWLSLGPFGTPDVVTLFASDAESLLDVYKATTLTITPTAINRPTELLTSSGWGWVWRQQKRGAADEHVAGAAIVTSRSIWATSGDVNMITRVSRLSIEWDEDDRPSGTLESDADQAFKPASVWGTPQSSIPSTGVSQSVARMRYNSFKVEAWSPAGSGMTVDRTSGPYVLDVFYDSDGSLLTFEWVYGSEPTYTSSELEYSQCNWWDYPDCFGTAVRWEQFEWRGPHFKYGAFESGRENAKIYREATPGGGAYPNAECYECAWIETTFQQYGCWAVQSQIPGFIWFVEDVRWSIEAEGGTMAEDPGVWGPIVVEDELPRPVSYGVSGSQALPMTQSFADAIITAGWTGNTRYMVSLVSYYDRMVVNGVNVPPGMSQALADDVTITGLNKVLSGWV